MKGEKDIVAEKLRSVEEADSGGHITNHSS